MASSSSSSPEISASRSRNQSDQPSVQTKLREVLEDLSSRFILNIPDEELASLERVCFQVEQAHWYYEDFIREQDDRLPTMSLKKFSNSLFHVCPLLSHWGDDHEQTFQNFLAYKTRVPVCGAIMLNETWDKCLLVKGWKSTSAWSFPKGKINEQEPRHRCAVREVLEETGYDLDGQIDTGNVVEISIKEQSISLFIVPNVPEDFPFKTRTRKEISQISWFKLTDLPTWKRNKAVPGKFYLITPFIGPLRNFIREHKPRNLPRRGPIRNAPISEPEIQASSDDDGSGAADEHSILTIDGTQESSSQSSSADNGEPHTPSPHYSEPPVNGHVPVVASQDLNLDNVDPSLARLLNCLKVSASATSTEDQAEKVPQSQQSGSIISEVLPSQDAAKRGHHSRTPSAAPRSTQPSPASVPTANPSRPPTSISHRGASPHLSTKTEVAPQRSPTLRRNSGIGPDTSPYFSRPPVASAIPKQMKYLTILENLAKESERATPTLERSLLGSNPDPSSQRISTAPYPKASHAPSIAPHAFTQDRESSVIYSSNSGLPAAHSAYHIPPSATLSSLDSLAPRPRTSNNFHNVSYPAHFARASMNDDQLRFMMSTTQPRPPTSHAYGHHAPQYRPQPSGVQPSMMRFPSGHPMQANSPQYQYAPTAAPIPTSAPAISPTFSQLPRVNPAPGNAQLLSILNSPNLPHLPPAVPHASTYTTIGPR
ncbi:DCP2-domain-containing protein [Panus rudis PR-1116 ss-1]|nr:DCP2-domain-containing protein [Panus rudis PR-1116 ss-1]